MEPVIKSKEKCLHCIYGVTGECSMYDDFGLPEDGDKCYNFMEADDEEMAEGYRIAHGDITLKDCVGWLNEQAGQHNPETPTANYYKMSAAYLLQMEKQHHEDELWMEETRSRNSFWNDFLEYITEKAVGDKLALLQVVHDNDHNWSEGYVKVTKRVNEKQELLLDFTTSKGDKRTATWQPSDNYACWQTCGIMGDDYSGFLLMPTYKDDEYFCIYYNC